MNNSPLNSRHLQLNAKMADFGGWLMPIEYPDTGVIAEYSAVRQQVGVFDVSHLGKISIKGEGALDFLNQMLTNDLNRITAGQAQYSLLCNEDGGVLIRSLTRKVCSAIISARFIAVFACAVLAKRVTTVIDESGFF